MSAEALVGLGITIGALGVLAFLLGWAEQMRAVPEGAMVGFVIGGVAVLLGGVLAAAGRAKKDRKL